MLQVQMPSDSLKQLEEGYTSSDVLQHVLSLTVWHMCCTAVALAQHQ
jgi:hypothetical protein